MDLGLLPTKVSFYISISCRKVGGVEAQRGSFMGSIVKCGEKTALQGWDINQC
jgi:hypothetical protein